MSYRLVRDRKFTQAVTDHFWFYFHFNKLFAVVNVNDNSDHFRQNRHIPHVCSDRHTSTFLELFLRMSYLFKKYPLFGC